MESLLPSNDMLGLNIICADEGDNDGITAAAAAMEKIRRKPKKNNKYEKRRAKARNAKLLQEKTTNANTKKVGDGIDVEKKKDVTTTGNTKVENINLSSSQQTENDNNGNDDGGVKDQTIIKEQPQQPISIPRRIHSNYSHFDPSPNTTRKNQQSRTEQLLKDELKRAEYMSTYHARPCEMDRKNNAVSKIQQSSESTHIFMDVDDDKDDQNKDNDSDCPFANCGLHPNIVRALTSSKGKALHLTRPTMIQRNAWEQILIQKHNSIQENNDIRKRNLFIQSETGSGKTLAYLLPIIQVSY